MIEQSFSKSTFQIILHITLYPKRQFSKIILVTIIENTFENKLPIRAKNYRFTLKNRVSCTEYATNMTGNCAEYVSNVLKTAVIYHIVQEHGKDNFSRYKQPVSEAFSNQTLYKMIEKGRKNRQKISPRDNDSVRKYCGCI